MVRGRKLNFLFLGFGPIASRFLENHVSPVMGNKVLIVSRNRSGIIANGISIVDEPGREIFKDIDVVINSWKSLESLNRGWEFEYLHRLANYANSKMLFVNLSSVAVYGEYKGPVDEGVDLNPINEYGIGKLEFENFLKEINMPNLFNLRISNVFGDFAFVDILNKIYNAIILGKSLEVVEPDRIMRDFISVNRVVSNINDLLNQLHLFQGNAFIDLNISTGKSLYLSEAIEIIEEVCKRKLVVDFTPSSRETILESRVSNAKLRHLIKTQNPAPSEEIRTYFLGQLCEKVLNYKVK